VESNERIQIAKIESEDRQAALKAQVDLLTAEMKAKSNEDIALMRAQLANVEAQIARMASGGAAEPPAPPVPTGQLP
jgi:hypothetical protein